MKSKSLILLLTLFVFVGCGKRLSEDSLLVVDNSASFPLMHLIKKGVNQTAETFGKEAYTGSRIKMVGFKQVKAAYKHVVLADHTLTLTVPVNESRRRQIIELKQKFSRAVAQLPLVNHTPLLEVVRFEAGLMLVGRPWHLKIISDFFQSTSALSFTPTYLASKEDSTIVKDMLKICPPPKNPPKSISLYWYPGPASKNQSVNLETHARVHNLFDQFFLAWAGKNCQITIEPLQE